MAVIIDDPRLIASKCKSSDTETLRAGNEAAHDLGHLLIRGCEKQIVVGKTHVIITVILCKSLSGKLERVVEGMTMVAGKGHVAHRREKPFLLPFSSMGLPLSMRAFFSSSSARCLSSWSFISRCRAKRSSSLCC